MPVQNEHEAQMASMLFVYLFFVLLRDFLSLFHTPNLTTFFRWATLDAVGRSAFLTACDASAWRVALTAVMHRPDAAEVAAAQRALHAPSCWRRVLGSPAARNIVFGGETQ